MAYVMTTTDEEITKAEAELCLRTGYMYAHHFKADGTGYVITETRKFHRPEVIHEEGSLIGVKHWLMARLRHTRYLQAL